MQRKLSQPNWKGQDMVPPPPPRPKSSKTWKCTCCVRLLRQVPRQVPQWQTLTEAGSYKFPRWSIDKIPPGSGRIYVRRTSYVQLGLCKPEDPSALRFLWWPHGNLDLEPEEFMMTTHPFGAVSSPSCTNFALRKTAADNQGNFSNEAVRTVAQNF